MCVNQHVASISAIPLQQNNMQYALYILLLSNVLQFALSIPVGFRFLVRLCLTRFLARLGLPKFSTAVEACPIRLVTVQTADE